MSVAYGRPVGFPRPEKPKKPVPPWNEPPWDRFSFFETERCTGYTLRTLGLEENRDYLFQKRIPVRGINQTGVNRADFWMLPNNGAARYGVGARPYSKGRILNPIASTTLIHDPTKDEKEKWLFRAQHFDIVYILDYMLFAAPKVMVEDALRGVDHSGR